MLRNMANEAATDYPGSSLGLPASGRGSLASWRARIAALIIDWAASLAVATLVVGTGALSWAEIGFSPSLRGALAVMVGIVVPAVVVGAERRGLDDLVLGTVVVNRTDGRTA